MKQIEIFELDNGKQPLTIWLNSLDKFFHSRILDRFDMIEEGYYGDYKIVNNEIKELRCKFGSGYRIYFHEAGDTILLLINGGDKSTQSKDIEKAKDYLKIWKGRNNV